MILTAVAVMFSSCTKNTDGGETEGGGTEGGGTEGTSVTVVVDATSKTAWHYYSFEQSKFVGSAEITEDAEWAKRTDWDMAICRYKVRTNSGTSGVGKGGTYTCDEGVKFDALTVAPSGMVIVDDISYTEEQMGGGMLTESRSTAVVSVMAGMPPVWGKSPLYIMSNASGTGFYKVDFLSYKDAEGTSGHVSFKFASVSK